MKPTAVPESAFDYTILPDALLQPGQQEQKVVFIPYSSGAPTIRGKGRLQKHMISLITAGEKFIHVGNTAIQLNPDSIMLLSRGNYLFTERLNQHNLLTSTMIYFDDEVLMNVINQLPQSEADAPADPFVLFKKDDYLHQYISSIQTLNASGNFIPALQLTKLNELLLYLFNKYPGQLQRFRHQPDHPDDKRIREVITDGLQHNLSIHELAFLCHMSISTFKRKFQNLYQQSPARWLQERRLEMAANLLRSGKAKPGDLFVLAGYENHSSFSKAFKAHYGVLPKDFQ